MLGQFQYLFPIPDLIKVNNRDMLIRDWFISKS